MSAEPCPREPDGDTIRREVATRLERLVLENFRGFSHLDLELPPGPFALFVGRNGSGKSTLVDALSWLLGSPRHGRREADVRHGATALSLRAVFDSGERRVTWAPPARPEEVATGTMGFVRVLDTIRPTQVDVLRSVEEDTARGWEEPTEDPWDPRHWALPNASYTFGFVLPWFRREENRENEVRLRRDPTHRSPRLELVRGCLQRFLVGLGWTSLSSPRISRVLPDGRPRSPATDGELVFDKDGMEIGFGELSDGERVVILTVLDLAIRAAHDDRDPATASGVVVIDEVDQHLHPAWQVQILPALHAAFPEIQFIGTTHAPLVVASVPTGSVMLLEQFAVVQARPSYGRDANSLLRLVFGVGPRPPALDALVHEVEQSIDRDDLQGARHQLDDLAARITDEDPEVVRLRSLVEFLAT
ncbi:MAG: AAA family ATPase [Myxococcota bacterium]